MSYTRTECGPALISLLQNSLYIHSLNEAARVDAEKDYDRVRTARG